MSNKTQNKIRILIAEDFDIIRQDFTEKINNQPDMEIVGAASSSSEIITLARSIPADIILMDMEMEQIHSGTHATKTILLENIDVDIIFLTIHETEEMVFEAISAGAVDYVIKTEEAEVLFEHIRNVYNDTPTLAPRLQSVLRNEFARMKRSEESLIFFVNKLSELTYSEKEIIRLLLLDKKISQIADIRTVEVVTVKSQIQAILRKFGLARTKNIVSLLRNLGLDKVFLQPED